jgi:uncharacterized membrane protein
MKEFFLYLMAFIYAAAGVYHFVNPRFYVKLMPSWMPWHGPLVLWSGIAEIALALLLLPEATRPASAWLIIAMLVVFFFTIHIPQTILFYKTQSKYLMISVIRLPIQFVLVWWAWLYTKPF